MNIIYFKGLFLQVTKLCYIYIISYGIKIMLGVLTLLGLYQDVLLYFVVYYTILNV